MVVRLNGLPILLFENLAGQLRLGVHLWRMLIVTLNPVMVGRSQNDAL
jgi:hypothetical protein